MRQINKESLEKIFKIYQDDEEMLEYIFGYLESFESYHSTIFKMEVWLKIYSYNNVEREEFNTIREMLDDSRTRCHNDVLSSINVLNKLAKDNELEAVYNGVVSKEQPFRREVADAVLTYVGDIMLERR